MNNKGYILSQAGADDFNVAEFIAQQILNGANTATLVKIKSVTNSGGLTPVGFVDVHPLVNQIDGSGNSMPHGTVYHIPYMRMQGGTNAIILDPQVGDIGIAIFADHDISSVVAAKGQANPGSWRRFDKSDGLYIGGFLNGTPTQYVQFSSAGIKLVSPTAIEFESPTLTHNGVSIGATHVHSGVTTGTSDTGPPV